MTKNNKSTFNDYIKEENNKSDKDLINQKNKIIEKYGKEHYDKINEISSKILNEIFKEK